MSFGFSVKRTYPAAPDRIFATLADVPSWKRWAWPVILCSKWENPAETETGGVRSAGIWPFLIREQITRHEPGKNISYRYVGRLVPVRDYHASIALTENPGNGGTDLHWTSSFEPRFRGSGRLVALVVRLPVLFMVWRLTKAAG